MKQRKTGRFICLIVSISLIVSAALFSIGCGGGSAGTGTTSFQGKLLTPENEPVAGAIVTVVETGESAVTDKNGQFVLETASSNNNVAIQVEAPDVTATVTVPRASSNDSKVGLELEVNSETATITVKNFEISAEIIGGCMSAFAKRQNTLVQVRRIPDGTKCIARVIATEKENPLGGIRVEIQRSRCETGGTWTSVASGRTSFTDPAGVSEVPFRFLDDNEHCRYRIVAPVKDPKRSPLVFDIETFRLRDFLTALPKE